MRLGSDALKLPGSRTLSPVEQIDNAANHGLDGLFFRTIQHLSPTLDAGELREARAAADAHGMYLEAGIGLINPYALAETPATRALGNGDTVGGMRHMMEAAAGIGITELWAETAGIKPYGGRFGYDRFRTDVAWTDQLEATTRFLHRLAPIARDLGVHINPETHEEITSFELVRLVEAVGPDVMGITYDTANMLQRAEHPKGTAARVAPYVRQTHIKDAVLVHDPGGVRDQMRPVGQGVVDMHWIIPAVYRANPQVNLSLEIAEVFPRPARPSAPRATGIAIYDPLWIDGHPDLTVAGLAEYLGLVQGFEDKVTAGTAPSVADYSARPYTEDDAWIWVEESLAYLRSVLADEGIPAE